MDSNITPLERFYQLEKSQADTIYLRQPINGKWIDLTWAEVGVEARKLAQAIKNENLPPGSHIGLISKNCSHWIITDLAIWMAGHISVPLYPTLSPDSIAYVLTHAEIKLTFVGKLDNWETQKSGISDSIKKVEFPFWKNDNCMAWSDFTKNCEPLIDTARPSLDDICTVIYTSGTTGDPKGAVHTFRSASTHIKQAATKLKFDHTERFFSYLPLSHVAERLLVELGSLSSGGTIYFAESLDTFKENMAFCRPTIFLGVPKIWIKFRQGVLAKLPQKKLNLLLSLPIINSVIKKKLREALSLDQTHIAIAGAAAMPKELLIWFERIGITILEAYGMTENFGVSAISLPGAVRFGTVGKIFKPNTEVKIAENGEILTRSESNMLGYYREETKTKEMIDEQGWIYTGDKGEIDSDGFLKITGRIKDAFKTSKGKYVTPAKIEEHFLMSEIIEQVCVIGMGLSAPLALVVLSEATKDKNQMDLNTELLETLEKVNSSIENYERVSHIIVINEQWSIENNLLTPTLKVKRNLVEEKYSSQAEEWANLKESKIIFTDK